MRVNTNMNALVAHNAMSKNTALAGSSMEKLSSGLRITKAGDDAAGLAISEKMRSQIRGLDQANRNVQDGISLIQTAEGGMEEITNILQRMRELSVQGSNDTYEPTERTKIQEEMTQLSAEITRISNTTEFNGKKLLDAAGTVKLQVGANSGQQIDVALTALSAGALGVSGLAVTNTTAANSAIVSIDAALGAVNTARATMGAQQNRLEYTQNNLTTSSENLTAAESRIRDVDVAKEMVNLSKLNILQQASQAMISQANQQPQGVLQLLR
ncbi:MAG: flagellin [Clostridium sp.]|nr:flagellin [Clostridium sp.]MDU7085276.1 flagellin [Clostridium sp.]